MRRAIAGFPQDGVGDWVAELTCGHGQHVRHTPPLSFRPWVVTAEGRARFLGYQLDCPLCNEAKSRAPDLDERHPDDVSQAPAITADDGQVPGVAVRSRDIEIRA